MPKPDKNLSKLLSCEARPLSMGRLAACMPPVRGARGIPKERISWEIRIIPDSREKERTSAFPGAPARGSLPETASALSAQRGAAFRGAFPIKSVFFFSENRIKARPGPHAATAVIGEERVGSSPPSRNGWIIGSRGALSRWQPDTGWPSPARRRSRPRPSWRRSGRR